MDAANRDESTAKMRRGPMDGTGNRNTALAAAVARRRCTQPARVDNLWYRSDVLTYAIISCRLTLIVRHYRVASYRGIATADDVDMGLQQTQGRLTFK